MRRAAVVLILCGALLAFGSSVAVAAPQSGSVAATDGNGNSDGSDPANGNGLKDGDPCGNGPNDNRPQPCTEIPEAPVMLLYPLAAVFAVGGFFFVYRRRRTREAATVTAQTHHP